MTRWRKGFSIAFAWLCLIAFAAIVLADVGPSRVHAQDKQEYKGSSNITTTPYVMPNQDWKIESSKPVFVGNAQWFESSQLYIKAVDDTTYGDHVVLIVDLMTGTRCYAIRTKHDPKYSLTCLSKEGGVMLGGSKNVFSPD